MAEYVKIAAIDAVLNGNEVTLPDTYVALQDAVTGFDGPGSYHIQLATGVGVGGGSNPGYKVTYGLAPSDSPAAMTVARVVLTPTGQLVFNDQRKLNVGNTGVNATIAQSAFGDGSYLQSGVVTARTLASGFSPTVAHGTAFPGSPVAYEMFYRDDLETLFVWNGTAWQGPSKLGELNDVAISAPSSGQVLTYDATSGKWKNAAAGGGGGGGTAIAFNATAIGTNWNPQGHTASSYFKSTASITLSAVPTFIRVRAVVQMDASSSGSYYGIAVSSDGTHFIASDISPVGSGYCEAYYGTLSSATIGSYFSPFQLGANQMALIELAILVASSSIVNVAATVNGTPVFGAGSFGSKTAFEVTAVDLTAPFYVYALGANIGNMIAAAYSTSLF